MLGAVAEPPDGRTALPPVEDVKRYREAAERCRRLAKTTLDKKARLILLETAEDFDREDAELEIDQAKPEGA